MWFFFCRVDGGLFCWWPLYMERARGMQGQYLILWSFLVIGWSSIVNLVWYTNWYKGSQRNCGIWRYPLPHCLETVPLVANLGTTNLQHAGTGGLTNKERWFNKSRSCVILSLSWHSNFKEDYHISDVMKRRQVFFSELWPVKLQLSEQISFGCKNCYAKMLLMWGCMIHVIGQLDNSILTNKTVDTKS